MNSLLIDIRFSSQGDCLVSMMPPILDDTAKYGEILLFVHYTLRIAKLTPRPDSRKALASFLLNAAASMTPDSTTSFLHSQGLAIVDTDKPTGKGFEIGFVFTHKTYELKVRPHGFGLHVKDQELYAPTTVIVLFCQLLLRRGADDYFAQQLQSAATYCGHAITAEKFDTQFEDQAAAALAARAYPRVLQHKS